MKTNKITQTEICIHDNITVGADVTYSTGGSNSFDSTEPEWSELECENEYVYIDIDGFEITLSEEQAKKYLKKYREKIDEEFIKEWF